MGHSGRARRSACRHRLPQGSTQAPRTPRRYANAGKPIHNLGGDGMTNLPLRVTINRIGEPTLEEYGLAKTPVDTPEASAQFWNSTVAIRQEHEHDKENLVVILLSTRLRPLAWNLVALGSANECTAHPREILRPAVVVGAYAFVLLHNHPSGDPSPSHADRRLTSSLREGASIMQINFIDHVIIGDAQLGHSGFFSFRNAGLL